LKPLDIQQIGEELAIRWDDATESYIRLEDLRRACPCAGCQGEVDVLGNLHKGPERALAASAFRLQRISQVGSYGIQPVWADHHSTGIYSFEYLRRLAGE
jgi:DUF971 family protein